MKSKLVGSLALLLGAALAALVILPNDRQSGEPSVSPNQSQANRVQERPGTSPRLGTDGAREPSGSPEHGLEAPGAVPIELLGSIYGQDIGFQIESVKATEAFAKDFSGESYFRWEPVYIDPHSVISGTYKDQEAMPDVISLSPFSDLVLIADKTSYTVFEESNGAIWKGAIRNSPDGRIEITIAGADDSPGFSIRITDPPLYVGIFETTHKNAYIAVQQIFVPGHAMHPQ